jgi:hypothetical protein
MINRISTELILNNNERNRGKYSPKVLFKSHDLLQSLQRSLLALGFGATHLLYRYHSLHNLPQMYLLRDLVKDIFIGWTCSYGF